MITVLATLVALAELPAGIVAGPREDTPPQVEVVTFGAGDLLFERWGHAALCLDYEDEAIADVCFNYGNTDFERIGALAWNFVRGDQPFWVDVMTRDTMVEWYAENDRDIWSQIVPLSPSQARQVERRVWRDLEPLHATYVYDHLADNCSTRVRDIIDEALGGFLRASASLTYPLTFRDIGVRGLASNPVLTAASEFLVGRTFDRQPTVWQAMFHPDVFREHLALVLDAPPLKVHARTGPPLPTETMTGRFGMLAIAVGLALLLLVTRGGRGPLWFASLYLGIWGVVVYALVLVSPVEALRMNEVAFVLVPLDLVLPILTPERRRMYARVRVFGLVVVSLLSAVAVLQQPLWVPILSAFLPLVAIASSRSSSLD